MIMRLGAGLIVALCLLAGPSAAHEVGEGAHARPPWQQASPWPDRLVLTFAGDPARSLAVNWRTDETVDVAHAEIALATPDARFDLSARRVRAETEQVSLAGVRLAERLFEINDNTGLAPVRYHSTVFEGLEPDTLYAYRVSGAEGIWSEWFQARTAPLSGPVSFLYLGDAQNGILSHWARTIRAAFAAAPDARFIIHAGDLVDHASRDYEWAQWFRAVGFIHGMMPAIPVAGNHEYFRVGVLPSDARRLLSILWRPQFRLPVEDQLPADLRETVYRVRYTEDIEVYVLDTQGGHLEAQAAWLDQALSGSDAKWRIVTFHHPVFSSGRDRDNRERRDLLLPVLRRHAVDLVLQGHDHTYARGAIGQTPQRVAATSSDGAAIDVMFVNSVSGAKQYEWSPGRWANYAADGVSLDRAAENTQFYQVIRIDGDRLTYQAFTADGQLYDAFSIEKGADGLKRLVEGEASTGAERVFETTAPYPGADGLND